MVWVYVGTYIIEQALGLACQNGRGAAPIALSRWYARTYDTYFPVLPLDKSRLMFYNKPMKINSRYYNSNATFSHVKGYCNSNYCMVQTQRTPYETYSILNQRTGEFVTAGVTRDHAVRVWNRTGVFGLPPMVTSA